MKDFYLFYCYSVAQSSPTVTPWTLACYPHLHLFFRSRITGINRTAEQFLGNVIDLHFLTSEIRVKNEKRAV